MGSDQPAESRNSSLIRVWRLRVMRVVYIFSLILCLSFPTVFLIYLPGVLSTGFTGLFCDNLYGCGFTPNGLSPLLIVESSPADRADIHSEDTLYAINGVPITPENYRPFSELFRVGDPGTFGEVGTGITVTLLDPQGNAREVTLTREYGWGIREVARWQILGFSNAAANAYILAEWLIVLIPCLLAGLFLGWRAWGQWTALLAGSAAFIIPQFTTGLPVPIPIITMLSVVNGTLGWLLLALQGFALPDGRIRPRWAWFIPFALPVLYLLGQGNFFVFGLLLLLISVIGHVQRYRTASPETRQAQKWLAYVLGIGTIVAIMGIFVQEYIFPAGATASSAGITIFIVNMIGKFGLLAIPLGLVIVSLRYRLWDIDLVINKSLVFAGVTAVLVIIFIAVLLALQFLLETVLGEAQTALAATISTAIVVLAFNPVRKRVRQFIDHRLYGLRYNMDEIKEAQKKPEIKRLGALSGKTIGEFTVLDLLGRGGMGEVYKAQMGNTTVALKLVPEELANNPEFRRRLEREGEALKGLQHPNIVHFHSAEENEGIYYIALEYVDGENLRARLLTQRLLLWNDASQWVNQIGSALEYMHHRHLIHRDVKPANIMLRARHNPDCEEAVLMDFGITKHLQDATGITTTGHPIGSIGYMAPEQILDSKKVDHRADIYALAVLLFEMLTGESPFKGSVGQLIFAHLQQPAPDPRSINTDIPLPVAVAIMQAMSKDPDDRPVSASHFLEMMQGDSAATANLLLA